MVEGSPIADGLSTGRHRGGPGPLNFWTRLRDHEPPNLTEQRLRALRCLDTAAQVAYGLVMSALLTPDLLRRLEQFQLLAARRAKSSAKGERRSRARGQSVEFADYRNYSHGDDFRYLDWNIYGRLERLFVKLYDEEREWPVPV